MLPTRRARECCCWSAAAAHTQRAQGVPGAYSGLASRLAYDGCTPAPFDQFELAFEARACLSVCSTHADACAPPPGSRAVPGGPRGASHRELAGGALSSTRTPCFLVAQLWNRAAFTATTTCCCATGCTLSGRCGARPFSLPGCSPGPSGQPESQALPACAARRRQGGHQASDEPSAGVAGRTPASCLCSRALSSAQALSQVDDYLRRMGVVKESVYDTAGAAKTVSENGLR